MEGRSRDPFDKDFLPLHSQGWEGSCSRLSLLRGSVSRGEGSLVGPVRKTL